MLRLGIVDFDSSHSIEFTRRLNHVGVDRDQRVEGARVVLGCPGTSVMSPERVPGFRARIEDCGVRIVDQPTDILGEIDAVLVLSVQGAAHLAGARPFLEAGLPTFVDKPFANSLADAEELCRLARDSNAVMFGTSAMRFSTEVLSLQEAVRKRLGPLHGCHVHGPSKRDPGNPGLFHYGIHSVEMLFTLMGTGCESVSCRHADDGDLVVARWSDGRLAGLRGLIGGATPYGVTAYCDAGVVAETVSSRYAYRNLLREIVRSFECGEPAVPHEETLEIVRFVLAAVHSERDGGAVTELAAATDDRTTTSGDAT